jgi:hypothetical protein
MKTFFTDSVLENFQTICSPINQYIEGWRIINLYIPGINVREQILDDYVNNIQEVE